MPLAARISLIPTMSIDLGGGVAKFNIACHQATCYWLHEEAKGTAPTATDYINRDLGSQDMMRAITALGQPVANSAALAQLPSGTVLIFRDLAGEPQHSCVITANGDIGGYNQPLWFYGGQPNMFSIHPKSAVTWSGYLVKPYQKPQHNLIAVTENTVVTYAMINF